MALVALLIMLFASEPAFTATPIGKLASAFKLATPALLATDELLATTELFDELDELTTTLDELDVFTLDELLTALDVDAAEPTIP